jgi:hypothetical protein
MISLVYFPFVNESALLLPRQEKGSKISQSPSPALGEGFRVRGVGIVAHRVIYIWMSKSKGAKRKGMAMATALSKDFA